ncbi:unnamed protein product [Bursaphelenchus xylophilus]|uniref:(pine wood nematode) hypothetical protein n=1 Tax=Bursaphelenchus xylophilus TaxID=6326 RepID=A0A1I7SL47_BURXY|nr:unnamed protein product [Bursaphelenchus xylophilus]CAG9129365.1 unnamed protein product [Bursaphelenchus xylophilus]
MMRLLSFAFALAVVGNVAGGDIEKLVSGFEAAQRRLLPEITIGLTRNEASLVRVLVLNRVRSSTGQMREALANKNVQKAYVKLLKASLKKANAEPHLTSYLVEVVKQQEALRELGERSPRALKAYWAVVEKFDQLSPATKRKIAWVDPSAGRLFGDKQLRALAEASAASGIHKSSESSESNSSSESNEKIIIEKTEKVASPEAVETPEDASGVPAPLSKATPVSKEAVQEEEGFEQLERIPHGAEFQPKKKATNLPTHSINFGVVESKSQELPEGIPILKPDITLEEMKKLAAQSLGFRRFRHY